MTACNKRTKDVVRYCIQLVKNQDICWELSEALKMLMILPNAENRELESASLARWSCKFPKNRSIWCLDKTKVKFAKKAIYILNLYISSYELNIIIPKNLLTACERLDNSGFLGWSNFWRSVGVRHTWLGVYTVHYPQPLLHPPAPSNLMFTEVSQRRHFYT